MTLRATLVLLLLLSSCRSDDHGIALSLRAWAASDGLVGLARACGVEEAALSPESDLGLTAYTQVLDLDRANDGTFTARVRVRVRYGVAPNPIHADSYDAEVRGTATRVPHAESTTPHLLPLPTFDGWTLDLAPVARCAASPTGLWSILEETFGEI